METIKTIIWLLNIFASITVIILVLMQQGKGADAGATFGGSGSAQGVFGSAGSANFLSRATAIAATVFFASCLSLVYIDTNVPKHGLDFSSVQQQNAPAKENKTSAPAADTKSAASSAQ
ncbi:MAG: preprotein translocase subunit SecG [Neisseria sp.]|uniref:preprotein translocase subunit SecG n=1 Tax=Neisseria sp. TaxID=192066 RepID=UPI0026DCAD74|nr:preprotein translocase subunit SecG [Neisseria sp.]MDO4641180.1 preprotein translocase subunit SecG [Neisseria sp.]